MAYPPYQEADESSRSLQPTWGSIFRVGLAVVVVVSATAYIRGTRPASDYWFTVLLFLPVGGVGLARAIFLIQSRLPRNTPDQMDCRGIPLDRPRLTLGGVVLIWLGVAAWLLPLGVALEWAVRFAILVPPAWFLWPLGGQLALVGVCSVAFAVVATLKELPYLCGLRPVLLELSSQSLQSGSEYELFVTIPGPVELRLAQVRLLCEELVRVHADDKPEARVIHEQELLTVTNLKIEATPYTTRCRVVIPPDARPTNADDAHQVRWVVRVHGHRAGARNGFRYEYPVEVHEDWEEDLWRPSSASEAITAPDHAFRPPDDRLAPGPGDHRNPA